MAKHTIYVSRRDAELWQRAEAYARAHRMPLSQLVMAALEQYLGPADDDGE